MSGLEIFISLLTGLLGAWIFEKLQAWRVERGHRTRLFHLQSESGQRDWQHWNIDEGKLADQPIDSYMSMKYIKNKEFEVEWSETESKEVVGGGNIYFENYVIGKLFFMYRTASVYAPAPADL